MKVEPPWKKSLRQINVAFLRVPLNSPTALGFCYSFIILIIPELLHHVPKKLGINDKQIPETDVVPWAQ